MPFAWAARPLFRLYSNELDTSADFPAVYRQEGNKLTDEEILKILGEYRKWVWLYFIVYFPLEQYFLTFMNCFHLRPEKMSRLTVIPGWIRIKVEPITELPESKF